MKTKTDVSVIIDGKPLKLSGYESEEYLQKIASYINGKSAELKSMDGYRMLDNDIKNSLMKINIADDYYKARDQIDILEEDIANRNKEAYEIKDKLVSANEEIEHLKKQNDRNKNNRR